MTAPQQLLDCELSFQVTVGGGTFSITDTVNVSVTGSNLQPEADGRIYATTGNRVEPFKRALPALNAALADHSRSEFTTRSVERSVGSRTQKDDQPSTAFDSANHEFAATRAERDVIAGFCLREQRQEIEPATRESDALHEFATLDRLFEAFEGLFDQ